jgi:hypothetical protein
MYGESEDRSKFSLFLRREWEDFWAKKVFFWLGIAWEPTCFGHGGDVTTDKTTRLPPTDNRYKI